MHKLWKLSYKVYEAVSAPDIDVDEFVGVDAIFKNYVFWKEMGILDITYQDKLLGYYCIPSLSKMLSYSDECIQMIASLYVDKREVDNKYTLLGSGRTYQ
jgi:hypothetical protein